MDTKSRARRGLSRRLAALCLALAAVTLAGSTASAQYFPRGGFNRGYGYGPGYYQRGYGGYGYGPGFYGRGYGGFGPRVYSRGYGGFYGGGYYGAPYVAPYPAPIVAPNTFYYGSYGGFY